jgi:Myb DNA-binding like
MVSNLTATSSNLSSNAGNSTWSDPLLHLANAASAASSSSGTTTLLGSPFSPSRGLQPPSTLNRPAGSLPFSTSVLPERKLLRDFIWDEKSGEPSTYDARRSAAKKAAEEAKKAASESNLNGAVGRSDEPVTEDEGDYTSAIMGGVSTLSQARSSSSSSSIPSSLGAAHPQGPVLRGRAKLYADSLRKQRGILLQIVDGKIQVRKDSVIVPTNQSSVPLPSSSGGPGHTVTMEESSLLTGSGGQFGGPSGFGFSESDKMVTSASFKKTAKPERWSPEDTLKFYEGLRSCGTDFSMLAALFENRTRTHIKHKFMKEERERPKLVEAALKSSIEFDVNALKEVIGVKQKIEREEKDELEAITKAVEEEAKREKAAQEELAKQRKEEEEKRLDEEKKERRARREKEKEEKAARKLATKAQREKERAEAKARKEIANRDKSARRDKERVKSVLRILFEDSSLKESALHGLKKDASSNKSKLTKKEKKKMMKELETKSITERDPNVSAKDAAYRFTIASKVNQLLQAHSARLRAKAEAERAAAKAVLERAKVSADAAAAAATAAAAGATPNAAASATSTNVRNKGTEKAANEKSDADLLAKVEKTVTKSAMSIVKSTVGGKMQEAHLAYFVAHVLPVPAEDAAVGELDDLEGVAVVDESGEPLEFLEPKRAMSSNDGRDLMNLFNRIAEEKLQRASDLKREFDGTIFLNAAELMRNGDLQGAQETNASLERGGKKRKSGDISHEKEDKSQKKRRK